MSKGLSICKCINTYLSAHVCLSSFFLNFSNLLCTSNILRVKIFLGGVLTLSTLTSVCTFSILFFLHFLRCWQGEFLKTIKGFSSMWSFPLFSWPYCLIRRWYCTEKLDASLSQVSKSLKVQALQYELSWDINQSCDALNFFYLLSSS